MIFREIFPRRSHATVLLALLSATSCSTIRLRGAMDTVERKYAVLFDEFEMGSEFGARDAARDLRDALLSPAIARDSPYAGDPDYRRFLAEAVETVDRIQREPSFESKGPARFRPEVSRRCDACHERFRHGK